MKRNKKKNNKSFSSLYFFKAELFRARNSPKSLAETVPRETPRKVVCIPGNGATFVDADATFKAEKVTVEEKRGLGNCFFCFGYPAHCSLPLFRRQFINYNARLRWWIVFETFLVLWCFPGLTVYVVLLGIKEEWKWLEMYSSCFRFSNGVPSALRGITSPRPSSSVGRASFKKVLRVRCNSTDVGLIPGRGIGV